MKNFFKKLAFVLALAMVVASVAPAATASAAAAPKLNRTSKKLYIGGDVTGDYTDTFDLNVKNKGNNNVTYSTANEDIAMVDAESGVVTAKGVGNTTITATLKDKDTDKVTKTLTAKFWIKRNADAAGISAASAALLDKPVMVGDTVKLNAYRMLGDEKVWSGLKVVTDKYSFVSGDEKVATVDNTGKITAVAPGETTITFHAYQYDAKTATPTTEDVVLKVVVVAKGIVDVKQTTSTKVEVTFGVAQDDTKVTKDTIILTPADATKATPVVKAVTWNEAKTVATVEVYLTFAHEAVYTVSIKDTDSKKDFTASVGDVASITITKPSIVVESKEDTITSVLKDAAGIEVSKASSARIDYSVVENVTNGYVVGDKVTVFEKGKTVVLKATYYTGKYNDKGEEIKVESNAFVVTAASEKDFNLTETKYSIVKTEAPAIVWDKDTLKNTLALGDVGTHQLRVFAKTNNNDTSYSGNTGFTFESLDTSKLSIDANGVLYPIAVGQVQVLVKHILTDKSFLVAVNIGAARKVTEFTLDKNFVTVSNASGQPNVVITATVKDQYGDAVTLKEGELLSKVSGGTGLIADGTTKLSFVAAGKTPGTYSYTIKLGDITRALTIIVKAPDSTSTLNPKLVLSTNTIDLAVNKDNLAGKSVTVSYEKHDGNGLLVEKLDLSNAKYTLTVKAPDGTDVSSAITGSAITTDKKIEFVTLADSVINKKLTQTGNYTITLKEGALTKGIAVIVVSDTQKKPMVSLSEFNISAVTGTAVNALSIFKIASTDNASTYAVTGVEYTVVSAPQGSEIKDNNIFDKTGPYTIQIKKVKVTETFTGAKTFVHEVVPTTTAQVIVTIK